MNWPNSERTVELLANARGGDADAVNDLMERHRESLRGMVRARIDRALAQRVDASDVVQDVLFEAHRRLEDYLADPKLPFHVWLRQLTKDRIVDMHRRHRGAQRRSVDREQPIVAQFADRSSMDLAGALKDDELTPAAKAIRNELERRFLVALDELSEDDREVVLLRHVEHLGNSEVAELLQISPPAAGMRYVRALRRLRAVLGEHPSLDG